MLTFIVLKSMKILNCLTEIENLCEQTLNVNLEFKSALGEAHVIGNWRKEYPC
jgi:hypothetical protein